MAFWGVEVKPGKPITHYCEKARGRLRISQATLAIGDATVRSTVQCNVGRRSPVLLCVLMPEKTESCHLELEFEEDDDVVFSVIGPRSVYLSGYYVQKLQGVCPLNDLSVKNQNSERKRKRHSKKNLKIKKRSKTEEKTHTIQAAKDNNTVLAKDNVHEVEVFTNIGNSNDDLTKKRKSELHDNQCGLHHAENQTQEQLVGLEEIHTEEIGEKYQEIPKEGNSVQVRPYVDSSRDDFQKERGENQELQIDNIISTVNTDILATYGQPDGMIKEKNEKIPSNGNLNLDTLDVEPNNTETTHMETDHQSADTGLSLKQTILKGGLIVEELKSGPPNAKVAASGKKVKIYYTAMVKDTGHVFESNVGKDALCFRLGDEAFIDGWNVGIDGMRAGEKRRLIVPPSMGFADNALGEDVPPNSWLIYEIDLLSVRR